MRILKKVLIGVPIVLMAGFLLWLIFHCILPFIALPLALANNYTDLKTGGDGFAYLIRDPNKKAAVCQYTYDPASGTNEITIPESYGDYPVKELGGYVGRGAPCPFSIDVKGVHSSAAAMLSNGSFDWYLIGEGLEPEYVDLVLNIGPNIKKIYADQPGMDTGKKLVIVRVYVNCDPGNRSFYSESGVLTRKNGEVVDGLLYWNQSYTSLQADAP